MSLPYLGGMRHINTLPGSFNQACGEIRSMSDEEVLEVLELIYRIKAKRRQPDETTGTPEALLRHVGKFSFNDGERDQLLAMVLEAREVGIR